jgi:L-ascorbate metabolism protein UlaG (beta-lactamase superfamily)
VFARIRVRVSALASVFCSRADPRASTDLPRCRGGDIEQAMREQTWLPAGVRPAKVSAEHGVELEYLGTAGFVVRARERTLVLDPYVTRVPLRRLWRPLRPDAELLARIVPAADDVLVGHAHFDHVLDAPEICRRTGARLIGARAVIEVGRAAGLPPEQLRETAGRELIESGAFRVRGLPSRHGKVFLGRVLFAGDITAPPAWPPRVAELKHGLVLNWHLQVGAFSLVHVDSADFVREELAGVRADVLCLCAAGRRYRPRYVEEAIELLRPRYVVPCHWDTMVTPIERRPRPLPGIDLAGMVREIEAAGAEAACLPILGRCTF